MKEEIAAANAVILPSAGRVNVPAATRLRARQVTIRRPPLMIGQFGRPEMKTQKTQYSKFIEPGRKTMHSAITAVRGFQSVSTFPESTRDTAVSINTEENQQPTDFCNKRKQQQADAYYLRSPSQNRNQSAVLSLHPRSSTFAPIC